MARRVDPKDPNEVKIYTVNWTRGLNAGATISTSTWIVPAGITKNSDSILTGNLQTSIVLSGGTAGSYELVNRVTTSDGETLEHTVTVWVRSQQTV